MGGVSSNNHTNIDVNIMDISEAFNWPSTCCYNNKSPPYGRTSRVWCNNKSPPYGRTSRVWCNKSPPYGRTSRVWCNNKSPPYDRTSRVWCNIKSPPYGRTSRVRDSLFAMKSVCAGGRGFAPRPGQYSEESFSSYQETGKVFSPEMPFYSKF